MALNGSASVPRTFGQAFTDAMKRAKLGPKELADKSGVPMPTISKFRSTGHIPRPDTLEALLPHLKVTLAELLHDVITPWGLPLCSGDAKSARGHPHQEHQPGKKRSAS